MAFDTSRTAGDICEEAIRLLLSGSRETMNKLASNVGTNATSVTLTYDITNVAADSYLEIGTEVYRVWEVNRPSKLATVEPHMIGSETATHVAGDLVYVNPRIFRHAAMKALNDELGALSSPAAGLFQVRTLEFTAESGTSDYDLNTGGVEILDILDVRISTPGGDDHWLQLNDWQLRRNSDSTMFPDGASLFMPVAISGRTVQVVYSAPFTLASATTTDIATTCGLPASAQDILAMGVLLRLGSVREIKRNFTEAQPDTRRATEVPATAVGNSFSYVRAMRDKRIGEEAARLMRKWPVRRRI